MRKDCKIPLMWFAKVCLLEGDSRPGQLRVDQMPRLIMGGGAGLQPGARAVLLFEGRPDVHCVAGDA
jgi:hypothetical protein